MDTTNKFLVGVHADGIVIMRPISRLTKDEALNLAAWLVVLADDTPPHKFLSLLEAVQGN